MHGMLRGIEAGSRLGIRVGAGCNEYRQSNSSQLLIIHDCCCFPQLLEVGAAESSGRFSVALGCKGKIRHFKLVAAGGSTARILAFQQHPSATARFVTEDSAS